MGRPSDSPVHYTIRGVPPEVDRALRLKAAQRKESLNRVVLDELTRAVVGRPVRADFSDLVGKWAPDQAFDEIVASQRQIDANKWK
jgi:plasmid stability protein